MLRSWQTTLLVAAVIVLAGKAGAQGVAPSADDIAVANLVRPGIESPDEHIGRFTWDGDVPAANQTLGRCLGSHFSGDTHRLTVVNYCSFPLVLSASFTEGRRCLLRGALPLLRIERGRIEGGGRLDSAMPDASLSTLDPLCASISLLTIAERSTRPTTAAAAQTILHTAAGRGVGVFALFGTLPNWSTWSYQRRIAGVSTLNNCTTRFALSTVTVDFGADRPVLPDYVDIDWANVSNLYELNGRIHLVQPGERPGGPGMARSLAFLDSADKRAAAEAMGTLVLHCAGHAVTSHSGSASNLDALIETLATSHELRV
jgi:hypothetical protein